MTPRKIKVYTSISLLILSILLAACAGEMPETVQPLPTLPEINNSAAIEAKTYLADVLDVPVDQITITNMEEEKWPDACLGLPEQDELCASVITPGFRVRLDHEGQEYILRTNEDGSLLRIESPADIQMESGQ